MYAQQYEVIVGLLAEIRDLLKVDQPDSQVLEVRVLSDSCGREDCPGPGHLFPVGPRVKAQCRGRADKSHYGAPEVHGPNCPARYEPGAPCDPDCGQHKSDHGATDDHVYVGDRDGCAVVPVGKMQRCGLPEASHHG